MGDQQDIAETNADTTVAESEETGSVVEVNGEKEEEAKSDPNASNQDKSAKYITLEMEAHCRKAFDMFDLDESGKISAAEFGTVMRSLGQNPTDEDIQELLKVYKIS